MSGTAPTLGPGAKIEAEYIVRETLGKGKGGGAVYRAKRCSRPGAPALALKYPASSNEIEALESVQESRAVPWLLATGNYMGHRFTVTQILGKAMSEFFRRIEPLSVDDKWQCVKVLGRLLLRRLEAVHRCGWVHGDVAPDNVLFGHTDEGYVSIFLIDFGCARRFPGGEAVKAFWNTVEFASARADKDTVREPYDDLESLGYVLCHGIFGDLPWFRWTRGRNNWEETRGRDCKRVQDVKFTFLRGEWCSLGFEWIGLMKMPLDLTKFLARCLYRPKAEDGLPDYNTLAELLGERPGERELQEAMDIGFLTEKCQDLAPEWQPEYVPPPPAPEPEPSFFTRSAEAKARSEPPVSAVHNASCSSLERKGGGSSPTADLAPERTRSSIFDFDELDDEAQKDAPCSSSSEPAVGEVPEEPEAASAEAAEKLSKQRFIVTESDRAGSPRPPRSPRTPKSWFDFDKLDDMDMIEVA